MPLSGTFSYEDLRGVVFSGALDEIVLFRDCDLRYANFMDVENVECLEFTRCKMENVKFPKNTRYETINAVYATIFIDHYMKVVYLNNKRIGVL